MMLGQTLKELARTSDETVALELLPDLVLLGRTRAAATAAGLSLNQYVLGACRAFLEHAGEEDWATLTSHLKNTDDPGTACLLGMTHWRMAEEEGAMARGCKPMQAVEEPTNEHA